MFSVEDRRGIYVIVVLSFGLIAAFTAVAVYSLYW